MDHWQEQQRRVSPGLAPGFAFSRPFWQGFLYQTVLPYKSIFLYDPLILLSISLAATRWRSLDAKVRLVLVAGVGLVVFYLAFYSRLIWIGGDPAWGNRYLTAPCELVGMLAVPILVRLAPGLPRWSRSLAWTVVALSVYVQVESVILPCGVEVSQSHQTRGKFFAVGQRSVNIIAMATGNFDRWGLSNEAIDQMQWNRLPNLSPFVVSRLFPGTLSRLVWAGWIALVVAYAGLFLPLARAAAGFRASQPPGRPSGILKAALGAPVRRARM